MKKVLITLVALLMILPVASAFDYSVCRNSMDMNYIVCKHEVNGDGFINFFDLLVVQNAYGKTDNESLRCDFNCDNVVNYKDFNSFIWVWSLLKLYGHTDKCMPPPQ